MTEQELVEQVLAHLDRMKALRKDVVERGALVLDEEGRHVINPSVASIADEWDSLDKLIQSYPHPLPEEIAGFYDTLNSMVCDEPPQSRTEDT